MTAKSIVNTSEMFGFFNPTRQYTVTWGQLPHWEQEGATYFITFRTAGSVPASVMRLWKRQRDDWLRRQQVDPDRHGWHLSFSRLPHRKQKAFRREFAGKLERFLDDCHGERLLRQTELSQIVADALVHFDGQRYHLGDFVVMPNHVHLLVCLLPGVRLRKQCYWWKHYIATEINQKIGRAGPLWQKESFDHLVRDADHFDRFRQYIADNPRKAKLPESEFYYHQRPDLPPLGARDTV